MQFRGHRLGCAKGSVQGMLTSTSRETSRPVRPKRMAWRNRSNDFSWRLLQGVHFLPQGFKDADTRRYDHQHRTRQDYPALADGYKVHRDVPSLWSNFFGMRLPLLLQRQKAVGAIRKIHSWQPQRILLSHGRSFDADADKVIRRIFGEPPR